MTDPITLTLKLTDEGLRLVDQTGRPLANVAKIETIVEPGGVVRTVVTIYGVGHELPTGQVITTGRPAGRIETARPIPMHRG